MRKKIVEIEGVNDGERRFLNIVYAPLLKLQKYERTYFSFFVFSFSLFAAGFALGICQAYGWVNKHTHTQDSIIMYFASYSIWMNFMFIGLSIGVAVLSYLFLNPIRAELARMIGLLFRIEGSGIDLGQCIRKLLEADPSLIKLMQKNHQLYYLLPKDLQNMKPKETEG